MSRTSTNINTLRVALVHDYLREYGGAERVLEALHGMFPQAPVYVAFTDPAAMGAQWSKFVNWDIRTTWAAKIPGIRRMYSPLRVLSSSFFSSLHLQDFDLVISSTNMYMAKAARAVPPAKHLSYCHTPPRSLYGYTTMTNWKKNGVVRIVGELLNHYMRKVDWESSRNPDVFIANSNEVQARIQKLYRRDSVVIHPPITMPATVPAQAKQPFVLYAGRLAFSKHVDVVVDACRELHQELRVVGSGGMLPELQARAGKETHFLGQVSDAELQALYATATVVAYPAEEEDFGMVPVEAMGNGTPVIVHRSGGSLETVVEGTTGLFVDTFQVDEMQRAIQTALQKKWNANTIHRHAQQFSVAVFEQKIRQLIAEQFSV